MCKYNWGEKKNKGWQSGLHSYHEKFSNKCEAIQEKTMKNKIIYIFLHTKYISEEKEN